MFENLCNRLRISLEESQKESEYKIMHLETKLEDISKSKETTELEQTKAFSEFKLQHSAAIAEEKEKSLFIQRQLQQTHEKDIKDRERKYELQANIEFSEY